MRWYNAENYRDKFDKKFDPSKINDRNLYRNLDIILGNISALENRAACFKLMSEHLEEIISEFGLSDKVSEVHQKMFDRMKAVDQDYIATFGITQALRQAGQLCLGLPEFQN